MTAAAFDPDIALAFRCKGQAQILAGGEGHSLRVGSCVLKPIETPPGYSWACDLLRRMSVEGFRVPEPRQAVDGSFVYRGWSASAYEPGEHVDGRWDEKLQITRIFHAKLSELDTSPMPPSDDPWSRAHEIAWLRSPLPTTLHPTIADKIQALFGLYRPLSRTGGIIHADICGNILFHEGLAPCVIDFSPAYGPVGYADAIMVADAIAWENAPISIADMLPSTEEYRQLLLRAISFRVVVAALFTPKNVKRFLKEYTDFGPVIDFVS